MVGTNYELVRPASAAPRDKYGLWSCIHHKTYSEVEALDVTTGKRQTIAEIHEVAESDVEDLANFIVHAANFHQKHLDLITQMTDALELCLACEGPLSWAAEHDAQVVVARAKQAI